MEIRNFALTTSVPVKNQSEKFQSCTWPQSKKALVVARWLIRDSWFFRAFKSLECLNERGSGCRKASRCYSVSAAVSLLLYCGLEEGLSEKVIQSLKNCGFRLRDRCCNWNAWSTKIDGMQLNRLRFANDIVLIVRSSEDAAQVQHKLHTK